MGRVASLLQLFGIDPAQAWRASRGLPAFRRDYRELKRQLAARPDLPFRFGKWYPCLTDRGEGRGTASGHYFHQDLLVAQRVFWANPVKHVDVGSRVDGFIAHVASFREIEVLDIQPQHAEVTNVSFRRADLTASPFPLADYCDSVSCLHAIEHFGLGRYGDPVDAAGHVHGLDNMRRLLKPGGTLYLSTLIGPQRIEFNGQRVFDVRYLLDLVDPHFTLRRMWYVDDDGRLHDAASADLAAIASNFGCMYGCGIFELAKRAPTGRGS